MSSSKQSLRFLLMNSKYSRLAVIFHWVIAMAILVMFPLGFYMADLPLSPRKLQLYSYHKWIGVSVFALVWLRLLWRRFIQSSALPTHYHQHIFVLSNLCYAVIYFFI